MGGDRESVKSKSVQKNVKIVEWIDKYTERKRSEREFENVRNKKVDFLWVIEKV